MTKPTHARWAAAAVVGASLAASLTAGLLASNEPPRAVKPRAAAPEMPDDCCGGTVPPVPPPREVKRVLWVAADPNNLPFTNDTLDGFENKIADIIAAELGAEVRYWWRAQRRGFFRQAFSEREADVVMGVPVGFDMALTTAPYYRSAYVFVTRRDRNLGVASLDDPALTTLKIGVQLIGDDSTNTPPAHALARRGIVDNVVGFTVFGDYREDSPPSRIVAAVARGDVDVAIAWGPLAGYFAKKQTVPLDVTPVKPEVDEPGLPLTFGISVGVRRGNKPLRDDIDLILKRRKADIDKVLDDYGVPRVARPQPKGER